jgi:hypothetical protein
MPINLPSNLSYGTVVGRFLLAYADGIDQDSNPDGAAAKGEIYLTPSIKYMKDATASPAPVTIIPSVVVCTLDVDGYLTSPAGQTGVRILATNDTDGNPTGWTWTARYKLTDQNDTPVVGIPDQTISVPAGQTIDLSVVGNG